MKKILGFVALIALCMALFGSNGTVAYAQRGGGGGGSSARKGGASNLIFDNCPAIENRIPSGSGVLTVTTYVTTVNLNIRVTNVSLPDNTELTVTVYARDWFTGLPWEPRVAGTISLSGRKGQMQALGVYQTAPGLVPIVTSIVITDFDGNVVMSGHP